MLWEDLDRTVILVTHDVEEAVLLSDRVVVLSQCPGTIVADIPVDLPRPWTYAIVTDQAFVSLKARLLAALRRQPTLGVVTDDA